MNKKKTTPKQAAGTKKPKATPPKVSSGTPQATQPKTQKTKNLSAIDAAAKVLGESKQPMNCRQMVEAMAAKGYWSSANGKTPSATLYSAILREVQNKGKEARFTKAERGKFTLAKGA